MKEEHTENGKVGSSVFALHDGQVVAHHATRILERFEETITELLGPIDSGMWKWVHGSDGATLIVKRWEDLGSGISQTGLVKLSIKEIEGMIHPQDFQRLKEDVIAHLENQAVEGFGVDFRARGKVGDWRWVRVETEAILRNHEGRPVQAVGCFVDVHDVCAILERLAPDEGSEAVARPQVRFSRAMPRTG